MNKGQIQKYHIEENHEAIIDPLIWEAVQSEFKRRKSYIVEHGTNSYSHNPETNPFYGKIVCGTCNQAFRRKGWMDGWKARNGYRKIWQCQERYRVKGVQGCTNRHIEEETIKKAFIIAWNSLLDKKIELRKRWELIADFGKPLEQYRAIQFANITENAEYIEDIDTDFILMVLDRIKIFETGKLVVKFLDGTEIML